MYTDSAVRVTILPNISSPQCYRGDCYCICIALDFAENLDNLTSSDTVSFMLTLPFELLWNVLEQYILD